MAKKKTVNKSESVRDYIRANPGIANKDVSATLTKLGIEVSPNYVGSIKSQMAANKGKRKRRHTAANAMSVKSGIGIDEIKAAFSLLKHCGGIAEAREALAAAVEIQKVL